MLSPRCRRSLSIRSMGQGKLQRGWLTLSLLVAVVGWTSNHAMAQSLEAQRRTSLVDESAPDRDDPSLQGEFAGRARDWNGYVGRLGLQVAARGEGKFEGTLFVDGLPFDGWDRKNQVSLQGTFVDDRVELVSADGLTTIEIPWKQEFAWVKDAEGRVCAGLNRVNRRSRTLGAKPPAGATILFDGEQLNGLEGAKVNAAGNLTVGFTTVNPVHDFELHVEFRLPFEPAQAGQGRGNSGVYIQRRYEVQILDSFASPIEFNGCASLYRQLPPSLNASLPPLQWQTYDIQFRAARWNEAGEKTEPARISVWHNGILVHNNVEIKSKTGAGQPESPEPLPILFQDHQNAVEFRNLWIKQLN